MHLPERDYVRKLKKYLSRCKKLDLNLTFMLIMPSWKLTEKVNDFSSWNSRAGFPYGAAKIFSLMQHMGCEPDRASYNILVDAYGKAGFQDDAEAVFEDMKRVGITPTMKSHMVLLSAYSKMGNVSKCEDILNQI
ncbi:unnamed protein product [Trifolium pratense]|uniref:Uncharacterized protein n=1 Tax=Trifolium pratense TaxID=57577 RepID=A0ACB0K2J3_TRIPR|nr:unnamed protein product [Trifolium pratense]